LWEGGFHGRLLVGETQALHAEGRRTAFVTQSRTRTFDLPENVLARAVCDRLLHVLTSLRLARALPDHGWGEGLRDAEGKLRHLLAATPLREVPAATVSSFHEAAAQRARDATYHALVRWWGWLRRALDDGDPERIAELVASGALLPIQESTRFEVAVVMRLVETIEDAFEAVMPGEWHRERSLIMPGRTDLAAFQRAGTAVRVFYNQVVLPAGGADSGARHYLGNTGRLRPDVTIVVERDGTRRHAMVAEVKHTHLLGYAVEGFHEAMLYRWEYALELTLRPKSVLVTSAPLVVGEIRPDDDVIAASWDTWPPARLVDAIVAAALDGGLPS
jgi:hypothetical protein